MSDSSNSGFSGIWKRENLDEIILDVAQEMKENKGEIGSDQRKPKTWGIGAFFLSLLAFFGLQIAILIPFLTALSNSQITDPNELLATATTPLFIVLSSLGMYIIWIVSMWLTTKFRGANSFKIDFKLAFKKWDVFYGLAIAAGLYVALYLFQLLLTEVFKINLEGSDNGQLIANQQGIWFLIVAVGIASILGPISEELYFRGFFMHSILKTIQNYKNRHNTLNLSKENAPVSTALINFFDKIKYPFTVIISSALFGMFHFQGSFDFAGIFTILVTGTLGSVFAIVTLKTKRLGPAIFGHMFYNFATLMIATIFAG